MTRKEAIEQIMKEHREELHALPLKKRIARTADLLAKYRMEHPELSEKWTAEYFKMELQG